MTRWKKICAVISLTSLGFCSSVFAKPVTITIDIQRMLGAGKPTSLANDMDKLTLMATYTGGAAMPWQLDCAVGLNMNCTKPPQVRYFDVSKYGKLNDNKLTLTLPKKVGVLGDTLSRIDMGVMPAVYGNIRLSFDKAHIKQALEDAAQNKPLDDRHYATTTHAMFYRKPEAVRNDTGKITADTLPYWISGKLSIQDGVFKKPKPPSYKSMAHAYTHGYFPSKTTQKLSEDLLKDSPIFKHLQLNSAKGKNTIRTHSNASGEQITWLTFDAFFKQDTHLTKYKRRSVKINATFENDTLIEFKSDVRQINSAEAQALLKQNMPKALTQSTELLKDDNFKLIYFSVPNAIWTINCHTQRTETVYCRLEKPTRADVAAVESVANQLRGLYIKKVAKNK